MPDEAVLEVAPIPVTDTPGVIPANPAYGTDVEYDPLTLDPARFLNPTGKPAAVEPVKDEGEKPAQITSKVPIPKDDENDNRLNVKQLRELRKKAEVEREQYLKERDEYKTRLDELEPRVRGYDAEREALQKKIAETDAGYKEAQAAAWRSNAREHPDWKATAQNITNAADVVSEILKTPVFKDAGLNHSRDTLLNPNMREALNETIRVLNDNGMYAEAQDLIDSHRSVNVWRGELRRIEADVAGQAEAWRNNRDGVIAQALSGVRNEIGSVNPQLDTKSAEFNAMPKEGQEFVLAQHAAAGEKAKAVLGLVDKPEALAAEAYRSTLAMRMAIEGSKGLQAQATAQAAEIADLKRRLADYEKAAGGGDGGLAGGGVGGGRAAAVNMDDPAEVARSLDPRNMPGYKGRVI